MADIIDRLTTPAECDQLANNVQEANPKLAIRARRKAVDFAYDSVYNRTSWTDTLSSIDVSYEDNELNQYTSAQGITPEYDSRGNMTCGYGRILTLGYDEENRLVSAGSASYTYDLQGRRISRTLSGLTTTYVWDGAHIIAEYEGSSLTKKYIYGPGMNNPVAMINVSGQNQTWYYYYADAQGSIRLMTDESGDIVESYTYDVYGRPRVMTAAGDGNWLTEDVGTTISSSIGNPYMFTGRRWDSYSQLYYYRFRDYAPKLGRFVQTDPAGYIDTMNLYAYCGNNPINWIDPWGLHRWPYHDPRPHKHEEGCDWDPQNNSPSEAGLNTLPHPYADHIFEESAKGAAGVYVGGIPYIGPVIENWDLIRVAWEALKYLLDPYGHMYDTDENNGNGKKDS